jgi:succinate dehydrogenase / fumarate reductase iron-sulfur subunit
MTLPSITVKLHRQASRQADANYQTYTIKANPDRTTVLDALIKIQEEQDGSIGFRRNCRNAICGSCAMRINGRSGLACQKHISEVMGAQDTELVIEPMHNLPVIKDLIVDMTKFWDNLHKVDPCKPLPNAPSSKLPPTVFSAVPAIQNVMLPP